MAPSTECKCTGRRVYSSSGYCMERMRCATRLATRYARYSLEPDTPVREPRPTPARRCSHAGCARAHARSGGSAPWPSGWLAAVQRSRDGDSRARQPRPSANGSRQLRWWWHTRIIKRKSREVTAREIICAVKLHRGEVASVSSGRVCVPDEKLVSARGKSHPNQPISRWHRCHPTCRRRPRVPALRSSARSCQPHSSVKDRSSTPIDADSIGSLKSVS